MKESHCETDGIKSRGAEGHRAPQAPPVPTSHTRRYFDARRSRYLLGRFGQCQFDRSDFADEATSKTSAASLDMFSLSKSGGENDHRGFGCQGYMAVR